MARNTEETIFNGSLAEEVRHLAEQAKAQKQERAKSRKWQKVAIGGVSGILLGSGTAYGGKLLYEHVTARLNNDGYPNDTGETDPSEVQVLESGVKMVNVSDNQSFNEAFNTARAKVGPGGAFNWHGNTYSTYRTSEWDKMSEEQHDAFANQLRGAREVEFAPQSTEDNDGVAVADDDGGGVTAMISDDVSDDIAIANVDEDADVQIVGVSSDLAEGTVVTVEDTPSIDHDVYVVDLDNSNYAQATDNDGLEDTSMTNTESYDTSNDSLMADSGATDVDPVVL